MEQNKIDVERQLTFEDTSDEYKAFVEKFKPKKTTDDCYTPEPIYEVVKNWACERYHIDPSTIVRPFWPGGDYERFEYTPDCVVLDNPPFSILSDIVNWYMKNNVRFFLFMPSLVGLHLGGELCCKIYASAKVTYENGAVVNTSFITNMDSDVVATSAPDLCELIEEANGKNQKANKKPMPKYEFPPELLTAARFDYFSHHGVPLEIRRGQSTFVRSLDYMRRVNKEIFGGGCYYPPLRRKPGSGPNGKRNSPNKPKLQQTRMA